MALDVTVGGANSDSYGTIAEADTYHAAFGNADWADLDDSVKEPALRRATQFIDSSYAFIGSVVTSTQALQWPRTGVVVDGFSVDSATIPTAIKRAQFETALRAVTEDLTADIEPGNVTEETVDVITVKYSEYSNNGQKRFPAIDKLLQKYVFGGSGYHRVVK
jgi:hypothetical protein